MTPIDTTPLQNWPARDGILTSADAVKSKAAGVLENTTAAQTTWRGLAAPGVYDSPHEATLRGALSPAVVAATAVSQGGASVQGLLSGFAGDLEGLERERKTLLDDIHRVESVTDPAPAPATISALERRVADLGKRFDEAVSALATALEFVDMDGEVHVPPPLVDQVPGWVASAVEAVAGSRTTAIGRTRTTVSFRIFGANVRIFSWLSAEKIAGRGWEVGFFGRPQLEGAAKRFRDALFKRFIFDFGGEKFKTVASKSSSWWRLSKTVAEEVRFQPSASMRLVGRGMGAFGGAVTMYSEEEKRYRELAEQHPELSENERRGRAVEAGVVRGGSQVLASAVTAAAIGSAFPGIGTAGGFLVGALVGGAMLIPIGGGKNVGDGVADVGENVYSSIRNGSTK